MVAKSVFAKFVYINERKVTSSRLCFIMFIIGIHNEICFDDDVQSIIAKKAKNCIKSNSPGGNICTFEN